MREEEGADYPQDQRFSTTHKKGGLGTRGFNFSQFDFAHLLPSGFMKNEDAVAEPTDV